MPKPPIPIRMSDSLREAAALRAKLLGFKDRSAYIRSLVRYDGLVGGEDHPVTMPIDHQSPREQDRIDAEILEWVKAGKKARGVLLERMIDRAIQAGAATAEDVKKAIRKEMGK